MADLNTIGGLHYEMMRRCYNEKSVAYKEYGAKGIKVCEEWHNRDNFRKWCNENGYVKGLRINRIDSTKDYSPENCIFANKNCKVKNGESQYRKNIRLQNELNRKMYNLPKNHCKTRLYRIYNAMHRRCENPNNESYKNYGGRGISVCEQWSGKLGFFEFYKWSMENGYSDNLTIDRINNDKGYSPENCRWTTNEIQTNNRRCSIKFLYKGTQQTLSEIAKKENIKYQLLYSRIKKGISLNNSITQIKNLDVK